MGYSFANRSELLAARNAWCADQAAAIATYGAIGMWNVSALTDLSYVFCATSSSCCMDSGCLTRVSCESFGCNPACVDFNEPIGSWDTSRVTTLRVRPGRDGSPVAQARELCG